MRTAVAHGAWILVLVGAAAWYAPGIREAVSRAWHQVLLPFRIAQLATEPPAPELVMPVAGARVAQVSDTWEAPRSGMRTHEGQDIFAPRGTPVYAVAPGYVVRVGENDLGGNVVVVVGSGGRGYYYAHLNAHGPDAQVGQWVATTSVIGYVGTSGNAEGTPPHLHLGVYTPQGPINPLPLLVNRE